jgi:hypothetical protein
MRVETGTARAFDGAGTGDCATFDNANATTTTRRHGSWTYNLYGGLAIESILWGLTLDEDIGLEFVSRLGNMEVRRARGAARERWADDHLVGRFSSHGSRRWCCEDVNVWGIGHEAKHGIEYKRR